MGLFHRTCQEHLPPPVNNFSIMSRTGTFKRVSQTGMADALMDSGFPEDILKMAADSSNAVTVTCSLPTVFSPLMLKTPKPQCSTFQQRQSWAKKHKKLTMGSLQLLPSEKNLLTLLKYPG